MKTKSELAAVREILAAHLIHEKEGLHVHVCITCGEVETWDTGSCDGCERTERVVTDLPLLSGSFDPETRKRHAGRMRIASDRERAARGAA